MRKAFSIRRPNSSAHAPSAPATRLSTASVTEDYSTGDEQSPSEPIQERFLPRVDSHSPPQQPTQLPGMRRAFSIRRQNNSPRTPSTQATRVSATSVAKEEDEQSVSDPIQRDPFYYNAPLIILVESTLFKVPRSYFEKSSLDMFRVTSLVQVGPRVQEVPYGLTDQQPLRLDGVAAAEFRCLLKAIIREDLEEDMSWMEWTSVLKLSQMWKMKLIHDLGLQKIPGRIHNLDQWIAALKISTQFRIQGLREIAIEELANKLSSLNKVELAIECGVEPWLTMGCTEFVTRQECISGEEEDRLGPSRTSNLFRVRHRRLQSLSTRMSRYDVYDVQADIQKSFESEFANIAAFDSSPVSYWQPNLRTATDPDDIRRDEEYYCIDVIFRVEDTLFKLPRYLFEESSDVFRDMFQLPAPEGIPPDGSSDEQPLVLEGIRKADFRLLLEALKFPRRYSKSKTNKSQNVPETDSYEKPMLFEEWVSVLELSCMWQMAKVRETAVKKILEFRVGRDDQTNLLRLSTKLRIKEIRDAAIQALSGVLQPIELVQLGTEFQVESWLLQGYQQLVEAPDGISVGDEKRLGWNTTSKLFRIRDEYLQMLCSNSGLSRRSIANPGRTIPNKIKEVFAEGLKEAVWVGE